MSPHKNSIKLSAFSTLRIFNTPHFQHSAFSTFAFSMLRTFNTPHFQHSALSTLRIFNAPHFQHSAFSTLRTFNTPHFQHSVFSALHIFNTPHFQHSGTPYSGTPSLRIFMQTNPEELSRGPTPRESTSGNFPVSSFLNLASLTETDTILIWLSTGTIHSFPYLNEYQKYQ